MKTKEEITALKQEYKALTTKLQELTEDELKLVIGGSDFKFNFDTDTTIDGGGKYNFHIYETPGMDSAREKFEAKIKDFNP